MILKVKMRYEIQNAQIISIISIGNTLTIDWIKIHGVTLSCLLISFSLSWIDDAFILELVQYTVSSAFTLHFLLFRAANMFSQFYSSIDTVITVTRPYLTVLVKRWWKSSWSSWQSCNINYIFFLHCCSFIISLTSTAYGWWHLTDTSFTVPEFTWQSSGQFFNRHLCQRVILHTKVTLTHLFVCCVLVSKV